MKYLKCLVFFVVLYSFGQELPPIQKFTTEDYSGDNQNWMVSQGNNDYIYVANNKGLLEYNGSEWVTYNTPNTTTIRAVKVIGARIYTGSYGDFGYWISNSLGTLDYVSLASKLGLDALENEQIWNVVDFKEWVVFQSNSKIYFYNTANDSFKTIPFKDIIYKIFKVNHQIYVHVAHQGLYVIKEGEPKLIFTEKPLANDRIINLFYSGGKLVILTRNSGFYIYKDQILLPWAIPVDPQLRTMTVFSGIQLQDGSFILGTISNGIVHINAKGQILYQITQKTGLGNNTVLSLFEDKAHNVWTGLDNGINCINITSPIRTFFDYQGALGTVYTTKVFKNTLYIGSNQGLFYRNINAGSSTFNFIEGTAGQVWDLYNFNDEFLFCGHHLGTFVIQKNKAIKISDTLGAWTFKPIAGTRLLLQGNYDGLYILENYNGLWRVRNKIDGFNSSSRYFEMSYNNEVMVSHEHKGFFRIGLNDSLTKAVRVNKEQHLPIGKSSSLVKYKDHLLYTSENGVYELGKELGVLKKDSILSNTIKNNKYVSGKLVVDENERLWAFSKDNISYITNDDITNKPVVSNIPIPSKLRKGVLGFENISYVAADTYVLGTANGYIKLNVSKINQEKQYQVFLNAVELLNFESTTIRYNKVKKAVLNYKEGILKFKYAVPKYNKYLDVKYRYKLIGHTKKWSAWDYKSEATFENLSYGDYTFVVSGKVGNTPTTNTVTYNFKVLPPWYASNTAIMFYVCLLAVISFITHKAYKRYYVKKFKRSQTEKEQVIMQMRNEKLNQEIDSKNRELAISTMSIIKKNRVLNKIKKELKNDRQYVNNANAIKLINNNLNDTKDWSFFEQAFNNADKDFLDKIKKSHPDLTPNDLRFCAYLRLNLSSKEMAPLLNISIKSVETKRYRLRKKLGLEHDSGLVNYILKF